MPDFTYTGLAELVRPDYFMGLTNFFVGICEDKFVIEFEIDEASMHDAALYYERRAPLLLHPNVLNVLEAYAHSLTERLIISATPRENASDFDPNGYTLQFCDNPGACLAVFSAAFFFAREAGVDLNTCRFDHAALLGVAQQMQQTPRWKMFDAPALAACRYVAGAARPVHRR